MKMNNRTHQKIIKSMQWENTHCLIGGGCEYWNTDTFGDFYCSHPYMQELGYYNEALLDKKIKSECKNKCLYKNRNGQ